VAKPGATKYFPRVSDPAFEIAARGVGTHQLLTPGPDLLPSGSRRGIKRFRSRHPFTQLLDYLSEPLVR
jgi:hypothetical protein